MDVDSAFAWMFIGAVIGWFVLSGHKSFFAWLHEERVRSAEAWEEISTRRNQRASTPAPKPVTPAAPPLSSVDLLIPPREDLLDGRGLILFNEEKTLRRELVDTPAERMTTEYFNNIERLRKIQRALMYYTPGEKDETAYGLILELTSSYATPAAPPATPPPSDHTSAASPAAPDDNPATLGALAAK